MKTTKFWHKTLFYQQSTQSETSEYYMKPDKNISAVVNYQFQLEYN